MPINLGDIYAKIIVDTTAMTAGLQRARAELNNFGKDIQVQQARTVASTSQQITAMSRMASGLRQASAEMAIAGAALTGAMAKTIQTGAEWNRHLQTIQANTGMTATETRQMQAAVEQLGVAYGGSLEKTSSGLMHAMNLFHNFAQAQAITAAGMKAAVATGGDEEQVINGLAKALKEWAIPAQQAGNVMNGLIFAAQRSNTTLPEMMNHTDRIRAAFANLHLPLSDTLALFATLTQHGLNASQAETQLLNITNRLIKPTNDMVKVIGLVSSTVDKDFKKAFTLDAVQREGWPALFERIRADAEKMKIPVDELATRLFPGLRGTLAGLIFTGTGITDLRTNVEKFQQQFGQQTALNKAVESSQQQLSVSLQKLHNQFIIMSGHIASDVTPGLVRLMQAIGNLFSAFERLSPAARSFLEWGALAGGATLLLGSRVLGLAATFYQLRASILAAQAAGGAAAGGGLLSKVLGSGIGTLGAAGAVLGVEHGFLGAIGNELQPTPVSGARENTVASLRRRIAQDTSLLAMGDAYMRSHGYNAVAYQHELAELQKDLRAAIGAGGSARPTPVAPVNPMAGGYGAKPLDEQMKAYAAQQKAAAKAARDAMRDAKRDAAETARDVYGAATGAFVEGVTGGKAGAEAEAKARREDLLAGMQGSLDEAKQVEEQANFWQERSDSMRKAWEALGVRFAQEKAARFLAEQKIIWSLFGGEAGQMAESAQGMAGNAQAALGRPRQWAAPPDHRWADFAQDQKKRADEMQKVWRDYRREVAGIFEGLFSDLLDGHKNIFGTILNDFKRMLVGMAAQAAAGSVVSGLKGLFGGLFGGGKTSSPLGAALTGMAGLFGFAEGGWVPGPVGKPVPAVVHGGEFVMSRDMLAGGGGVTIHVHPSPGMDERSLARAVGRQLQLQLRTR